MHLKPTAGCQISTSIFENKLWREVSINIPNKYIKDGKVLAHFWLSYGICIGFPQNPNIKAVI
jgi:hypothetical protein